MEVPDVGGTHCPLFDSPDLVSESLVLFAEAK
jgi:hypothetical protein